MGHAASRLSQFITILKVNDEGSPASLPNSPNHYRSFLSHTLHIRYNNSLFISNTHLSRRKLRVTNPIYTRKRSLNIFYLLIPSCRTRLILWIIYIYRNLKHWSTSTVRSHSHSIYRLRPSMRTNIILRCHSYYKPPISHPIYWNNPSRMNLRGLLSRQSHLDPILRFPLHLTIYYRGPSNRSPPLPPRNRIKQPNRIKLRCR